MGNRFCRSRSICLALALAGACAVPAFAQCGGYERWAVKVGTDPGAASIDIAHPIPVTIQQLIAMTPPSSVPSGNDGTRLASETAVYSVTCRLVQFKQEGGTGDMDYHMVLSDDTLLFTSSTGANAGHSIVAESASPSCISGSHNDGPSVSVWQSQFNAVRTAINARFPNIPSTGWVDAGGARVRVTGVCFFDPVHGQTGRTNGSTSGTTLELHPITSIEFLDGGSTTNTVTATITTPANDVSVNTGTAMSFAGAATDSDASATFSYSWDFGDGSTASVATTSHTFTNTGTAPATHTVTFTATDNTGVSSTATRAITVNPSSAPPSTTYSEVEPNDTMSTANSVGSSVTQIIGYFPSSSDNDDYFAVNLLAGHTLTVDMTGPTASGQDYDLYLYSSGGTLLAKSEASSTTEHVSYKNTNSSASKTIYINVHRYASYSYTTPYTLILAR